MSTIWKIIFNPNAGAGKGKTDQKKILQLLKNNNIDYSIAISERPKHSIELARVAIIEGYRNIIAVGGDGTLNEIVNGIFTQKKVNASDIQLALIPIGTGNDWAKTFGISSNYKKAINIIKTNTIFKQDVGKVVIDSKSGEKERFFINMAGFGFDAMTAKKANELKLKGYRGKKVYIWSLIVSYIKFRFKIVELKIDTQLHRFNFFSASVGIGKYNGGGIKQAPNAIPNNGKFSITVIKKISLWNILKNIAGLYNGNFVKDKHIETFVGESIKINSKLSLLGEVDGEYIGNTSYKIKIISKSLNVIIGSCKF